MQQSGAVACTCSDATIAVFMCSPSIEDACAAIAGQNGTATIDAPRDSAAIHNFMHAWCRTKQFSSTGVYTRKIPVSLRFNCGTLRGMKPLRASTALFVATALVGAGCSFSKPLISPNIAEPLNETLVERPIAQRNGFGPIPRVSAPIKTSASSGTVRLATDFPSIPSEVTVLRVETGRPSDPQLRNLAGLFSIPNEVVGSQPTSQELTFDWKDEAGLHWTYHAASRRVEFVREQAPRLPPSVTAWPAASSAVNDVATFLAAHGIIQSRFGDPYIEPHWPAWMDSQARQGRCMTTASIAAIRNQSASTFEQRFPELPFSNSATCRTPEYPARILVRQNAAQDNQGIFHSDGSSLLGSTIALDATTGDLLAGWILLAVDPDRSDYPAITAADARQLLLSGGQGGAPNGNVTITKTTFEWMSIKDTRTPQTEYLYPAIIGYGTIIYANNTTGPYRIVVPLVKN